MSSGEGKIQGLYLSNFTCFSDLEVNFSDGINVIIGENGLGKTHLLKISLSMASSNNQDIFSSTPKSNLLLFSQFSEPSLTPIQDQASHEFYAYIFGINNRAQLGKNNQSDWKTVLTHQLDDKQNLLFIPVNEMLSWYKGFIPAFENRESSIDYAYYLLARNLAPLPLKGDKLKEQKNLIQDLESELGFKVIRRNDEFFIAFAQDQVHNSKLVANGINKLAQLIYLIMNGSLTKTSVIFWDEPEAGLNPKYIVLVAKFLQTLAKAGCQIFVATHDYLLSHTLSLASEYRDLEPDTPSIRFHSLYKTSDGTQIESADTLPEIQHNSILDEYSRFYKTEEDLFYKSMKVEE